MHEGRACRIGPRPAGECVAHAAAGNTSAYRTGLVDLAYDVQTNARAQLPGLAGVVAVPNEVFYARPEHGRHMVRFACCKRLDVIDEAVERLVKGFAA